MRSIQLLLLLIFHLTALAQSEDLPNLKIVYKTLEEDFKSIRGNLSESSLPDTVYNPTVKVEYALNNQIRKVPGQGYLYFAFLGADKSQERAKLRVELWAKELSKLIKGYTLKNKKLAIIQDSNTGYQYTKSQGLKDFSISIFYYFIESSGDYPICLVLASTKKASSKSTKR